jgi:outer membrane protein assembly factor BamD (BamD/ComL family)
MTRRLIASAVMAWVLSCLSLGSANAQIASGKASHSDVALFQQAQKALKKSNYAEARSLFENLIDTHPDSDYVPRARLAIADSWYSEHAFKQAELVSCPSGSCHKLKACAAVVRCA